VVAPEEPIQARGHRRAIAIAAGPSVVVGVVVLAVLGAVGLPIVGVVAGVVIGAAIFMAVWFGSERLLIARLGGVFVAENDVPRAANLVDGLCASMGLPYPEILLIDDQFRGALVLGRNEHRATLVFTKGLLFALDPVELEGVLAHELSHVKTGDMAAATMAATVMLPFAALFAGSPEMVLKLAGKGRELQADRHASTVTRYPPGLRDALVKMAGGPSPAAPSPVASAGVGRVLRWLWTVVPDLMAPKSNVGLLDSAATRVAALDEA
jgi:Zn-dependent protease with chaperone function